MGKVIAVTYTPELGMLVDQLTSQLSSEQLRLVTKTEVIQAAIALYHSAVVSGNIHVLMEDKQIGPLFRKNLRLVRGIEEEREGKGKNGEDQGQQQR